MAAGAEERVTVYKTAQTDVANFCKAADASIQTPT